MERPVIYQILVRLFGNTKTPSRKWGTVLENGTGKMNDITDKALLEIRKMGFTHVWYTGLIEHATCTDYTEFDIPADHPSVVKGVAGSPYAIKDYYDIAPDLASSVPDRMNEFKSLLNRTHQHGLKFIIDFVPNHLARQYHSDVKPKGIKDFGISDDIHQSYLPSNNFYYIPDETLQVPQSQNNLQSTHDSYIEHPAKATGNNVFSSKPAISDWYETAKLNYGVDYLNEGKRNFDPIPDTWLKMKDILIFWAKQGVDGFRCDMAEMVPVEFWEWVIQEVKSKHKELLFIGEVYQPDLYRNYIHQGGFDYLYDKVGLYDTLKSIIQGHVSADQLTHVWQSQEGIADHMLRFLENHDEQRIASPFFAADPMKGIPMMAASAFMHKGPVMIYFGQEVGEPAAGESGFSGDDGRSTLFDYWHVPEHQKWMNEGAFDGEKLSLQQKLHREQYIKILTQCNEVECFREGQFYDLQYFNRNHDYEGYSDKIFAFLRYTENNGILMVINFGPSEELISLKIPMDALKKMQLDNMDAIQIQSVQSRIVRVSELIDITSDPGWKETLSPYSYKLFRVRASQ